MADADTPTSQGDNNNFDNDFEKLDPFHSDHGPSEMDNNLGFGIGSTTGQSPEQAEEDLYSPPPGLGSEAEAAKPLVSFDEEPEPAIPAAPFVLPDSSATEAEKPVPSQPSAPAKEKKPKSGGEDLWTMSIDPRVVDLIYWRDVKKTGVVFGSMVVLLLSLAMFSVLSVVAYLCLAILTVTISFVVYKKVLGAVQKTGEGHPFKQYLEVDISLSEEKVEQLARAMFQHLTKTSKELRRLFLVEDVVDSLKFGLLLWVLTYIGSWFNGMTLLILAEVAIFTLPKVYETYKVQIDQYYDKAKTQVKAVLKQVQEKIPLPGKKKQN